MAKKAEKPIEKMKKVKDSPIVAPEIVLEKPSSVVEELANSDSGEEDEGIDEEGMAKLMKALGEDGLDEVGQLQLKALNGEQEDDESEDEDEDNGGSDVPQEEGSERETNEGEVDSEEEENGLVNGADEERIALEDVESIDEDAIPQQKVVTDNKKALGRIRELIKLDSDLPWTETLTVTYPEVIAVDVDDDLNRELAFYKQALHGANAARKFADQHKLPFTRPSDYFAEMVKSDAHMERIRQRLLDEDAAMKKSENKRKEREGKKFGKQVQIEKQKEREKNKKELEERLKGLKRKRKDVLKDPHANDDAFDVEVEDAISDRPAKRSRTGGPNMSRKGRDAKFGFGGKGHRSKQNTRDSTEKFDYGNRKGAGKSPKTGKPKRPGKSKRKVSRGR